MGDIGVASPSGGLPVVATPPDSIEITVRPPSADVHGRPQQGGVDRKNASLSQRCRQILLARQASGSNDLVDDGVRMLLRSSRAAGPAGRSGSEDASVFARPNDDGSSMEALYEQQTRSSYDPCEDLTAFDFSCAVGGGGEGRDRDRDSEDAGQLTPGAPSAAPPRTGDDTSSTPTGADRIPPPRSAPPRLDHLPTFGNSMGETNLARNPRNRGWSPSHDTTMRRWKSQAFVYMQLQRDAYEFYRLVYNILTLPLIVMTIAAGILVNTDQCKSDHLVVRIVVSVLSLTSTLLTALLRQIQPAELSQEHKGVSANYHIILHSMEFCMRVPYHMRPDATVYMEKVRNDMDRLVIKQSSPPLFVVRSYEKRIGGIDGIMYGDDIVDVMLNNVKTDVMLQQLKGEGRKKIVSNAVGDVLDLIKRSS